ncbi:Rrf2 family transcriptional regulator [Pontibacterium sp. N1Y112]|uniref:Rrf2 family transcriptional regulator n=1 Tax=Pontibacterium sinense TaxID=2781979 RepID=A0A8J7FAV1_9GAMM|nr:Rrf2 family transcriptional regulator [Pontibacterium sinense]MBE9396264.1 Rrf2 family transcriptional regulator [Pontibacterium sinense]|tara:strand:+ start:741 stop:1169 length:429 start_codon:yes stop_codon:yes gene_type:complete
MQLSRFTDYTLRVLFFTAVNNDRLTTLAEIAGFYEISIEHLRKVVHALSKSGYLQTFRGKNGGIRLAKAPEDINLGDVIAQSEGIAPLVDCMGQDCKLTGFCSLQSVFKEAQEAFMNTLRKYTLAQMLESPQLQAELITKGR